MCRFAKSFAVSNTAYSLFVVQRPSSAPTTPLHSTSTQNTHTRGSDGAGTAAAAARDLPIAEHTKVRRPLRRPPTNPPASLAAALDQHKHRHLHALRAVSPAQKQQFGKQAEQQQAYCAAARVCPTSSKSLKSRGLRWSREGFLWWTDLAASGVPQTGGGRTESMRADRPGIKDQTYSHDWAR